MAENSLIAWSPQPGPQMLAVQCQALDLCFGGSRGGGKGLTSLSRVLTPFGWKPIGSLEVGSKLCAVDGTVTHVLAVYHRGIQPVFRCHLSDGTHLDVDEDHIWYGWRANQVRKLANERTSGIDSARKYSMRELMGFVNVERGRTTYATNRFAIPVPRPVSFNVAGSLYGHGNFVKRDVLHPYVLGVLLGDGCITGDAVFFASADAEIPERVAGLIGDGKLSCHDSGKACKSYRIVDGGRLRERLTVLGLMGKSAAEKSIPRIYLMGSVEERWELLRGLMDTDGWAEADGDIYYTTISGNLAENIRELAWSLGGVVTIRDRIPTYVYKGEKRDGQRAYTLRIKFEDNSMAFRLPRKRDLVTGKEYQSLSRYIEGIDSIGEEETVCIVVAHPSSLFIAENYIVTHNSDFLLGDIAIKASMYGRAFRALFLRRTLTEMNEIHRRAQEIYPKIGATWAESKETWTFQDGGTCRMTYLEDDRDAERYMGHAYTYIAVDEGGNFPSPDPLDKLFGAMRSAEGIPVYRRITANPGGPGHSWIYDRYIRHGPWIYRKWQPQPRIAPNVWITSVFIPSLLKDNKILTENDPTYEARLALVGDETLVRAWRDGDWTVLAGIYFDNFREENLVSHPPEFKPWWPRYLAGDWGFSSWSAFYWGCWDGETLWVYREFSAKGLDPTALAEAVADANAGDKIDRFFFSHDAFSKRTSERSMALEMNDAFIRVNASIPMPEVADYNRVAGWQLMYQGFRKRSIVLSPECRRLIGTITLLVRDPKKPEDVLKCDSDHWADALRYLCMGRFRADPSTPRSVEVANFIDAASDPNVKAMRARLAAAQEADEDVPVRLFGGGRRF